MNKEGSSYKKQPLALPIIVDTRKFADDQSIFFFFFGDILIVFQLQIY